jgi:hypothetical protein
MEELRLSASGAISDLQKLGAIEGIHYRISHSEDSLAGYAVAVDTGPVVELMKFDGAVCQSEPGFAGFAIVNADCMQMIGCHGIAGLMRDGTLPAEVAYMAVPDE